MEQDFLQITSHLPMTTGFEYASTLSVGDHYEWTEGLRKAGPPVFSALFFIVTGFHGFHVLSGVVININSYI